MQNKFPGCERELWNGEQGTEKNAAIVALWGNE
jgi:hypothetical protein